jgi:type I phosphodiesterase/nucleotide pyrophosphatase
MRKLTHLLGLGLALAAGCDPGRAAYRAPTSPAPAPETTTAPAQRPNAATPSRPALVIALIFDQLGSETLLKHLPLLDPRGVIRQALARGAFFERSVYPYALTVTAPGHAAIHTGAPPSINGIGGNSDWDPRRGQSVESCDDPRHPVFGREADGASVSAMRLRAPTVAHALKAESSGAARVISLSLKDRSAAFSVGSAGDLVLWYDAKLARFTSSSAWGTALPAWLAPYQAQHPISALLTPWLPLSESEYLARLGPDAAPGEGDLDGFGTTFPHGWAGVGAPYSVLSCTPMLSEYLVDLAAAAVATHELGRDTTPDLLALSISGTDCAGHVFGPDSWEYVDHLARVDRALGEWLARLEQTLPLALLITSDHGVAPLQETHPGTGGRLLPRRIQAHVEAALVAELGSGPWLTGMRTPFLYLSARAREPAHEAAVQKKALAALRSFPGVRDAWAVSEVRQWSADADPLRRGMALSVTPDESADLVFLPALHYTVDLGNPGGQGTNHGTPYSYDNQVPVLAFGVGVPRLRQAAPVDQLRVAATLSHMLGVTPPARALPQPLF